MPTPTGQLISKQFFLPSMTAGLTYPLDSYAAFGYTIVSVCGLKTLNGSVNATVSIGSTAVTGLNGIAATTTSGSTVFSATANNVVLPGDAVKVVFDTPSSLQNVQFTLIVVRNDPLSGFVNKFRNPVMDIAQRVSGAVLVNTTDYTLDGWRLTATGGNVSWNQANLVISGNGIYAAHSLALQGTGSTTNILVGQRIESSIAASLSGKQVTFQCVVANFTGSTVTAKLFTQVLSATDNWATASTQVSYEPLQSCPTGGSTVVSYTFTCSGNAYFGYGAFLELSGAGVVTSGMYLTQFDIRVTPGIPTGINNTPPVPEIRPVAVELAFCQRYFNSTFGNGVTPAQNVGFAGAIDVVGQVNNALIGVPWYFPVQMRSVPTLTTYSPNAASANWSTNSNTPTFTAGNIGTTCANLRAGTALTPGTSYSIHATASAEL